MAVVAKAKSTLDMINGVAVVLGGDGLPATHDDTTRTTHFASGDSLRCFQTLDSRFKNAPSGWSH